MIFEYVARGHIPQYKLVKNVFLKIIGYSYLYAGTYPPIQMVGGLGAQTLCPKRRARGSQTIFFRWGSGGLLAQPVEV